jgi:hypothetical protein
MWFDRAVPWMDRHEPHEDQLHRFRAGAEDVPAESRKS